MNKFMQQILITSRKLSAIVQTISHSQSLAGLKAQLNFE